jgi:hypothetical protein
MARCPMERALTPTQCAKMRGFLSAITRYSQNNLKINAGYFLQEYRLYLTGKKTQGGFKSEMPPNA